MNGRQTDRVIFTVLPAVPVLSQDTSFVVNDAAAGELSVRIKVFIGGIGDPGAAFIEKSVDKESGSQEEHQ